MDTAVVIVGANRNPGTCLALSQMLSVATASPCASLAWAVQPACTLTQTALVHALYNVLLPTQVEVLLSDIDNWQFDSFKLADAANNRPLSLLTFHLLHRMQLTRKVSGQ